MSKNIKTKNKVEEEREKVKEVKKIDTSLEVEEEDLAEDVQEALGIQKQSKAKIKEVDYISELENGLDDDFGLGETTHKNNFDDDFDSDII